MMASANTYRHTKVSGRLSHQWQNFIVLVFFLDDALSKESLGEKQNERESGESKNEKTQHVHSMLSKIEDN